MSKVACIFGRRGSGKSTLARTLVAPCTRLILFNTLGEEAHNEIGLVFREPQALFDYVQEAPQFRAIADFQDDTLFPWTIDLAMAVGSCTLLVDEIDRHCSPVSVPDELNSCVRYGRHKSVSLLTISRRPADVPRIVSSQAEDIFVFRINEPRDVSYLKQYVGDDEFTRLPEFTHKHYSV